MSMIMVTIAAVAVVGHCCNVDTIDWGSDAFLVCFVNPVVLECKSRGDRRQEKVDII